MDVLDGGMTRPVIGISGASSEVDASLGRIVWDGVSRAYVAAVHAAGGIPVILPIMDPGLASTVCRRVDGLVFTGGGDIDPETYGQKAVAQVYGVSASRDQFEYELLRNAVHMSVPVLAICRGMQMLNVVFGGTLHQHLVDHTTHLDIPNAFEGTQEASVLEGSHLRTVVGVDRVNVNSLHHQAVNTLGSGLRVTARSTDGIVEGLEVEGCSTIIGIQWHPELLVQSDTQAKLFDWLIAQASGAKAITT